MVYIGHIHLLHGKSNLKHLNKLIIYNNCNLTYRLWREGFAPLIPQHYLEKIFVMAAVDLSEGKKLSQK